MFLRVLLIQSDAAGAATVLEALREGGDDAYIVDWVRSCDEGLQRLGDPRRIPSRDASVYAAVIVDLTLEDAGVAPGIDRVQRAAGPVPVLVLCSRVDEAAACLAVQRGAQDYLLKERIDGYLLQRTLRRIAERAEADERLFGEQERARITLNSIGDAVISTDLEGHVAYLNPVAAAMTGWPLAEACGRPLEFVCRIVDAVTREPVPNPAALAIADDVTVGLTPHAVLIRRDGHEVHIEDSIAPIHDRRGAVIGAVMVFRDVTATHAATLKLTHLAEHDSLTNLPNRALLRDRLTQAIAMAKRQRHSMAVLFLDIDRFKHINDSLGHDVGDQMLVAVAERLLTCVRSSDTVSRQGGDEFVVLLSELKHAEDGATIALKIMTALSSLVRIGAHEVHVSGSIGIATYPGDGCTADELIKHADLAMYSAKEHGRNNWQFYSPVMNAEAIDRQSLEIGLRNAITNDQLLLHYQPIVNLDTGTITGVEALVRWAHPTRGMLQPAEFLGIAEECGLGTALSQWVLRQACTQARAWTDSGLPPITLAVNVSPAELRRPGYAAEILSILASTGCSPHCLVLELVESVFFQHDAATSVAVGELKALGVRFALDDFGTGFSSLTHLRRFPIDVVKIDQSFIRGIPADADNASIVDAIIKLAAQLHVAVVAEGVETLEQLTFLAQHGCPSAQGYYLSPPASAAAVATLQRNGRPEPLKQHNGVRHEATAMARSAAAHLVTLEAPPAQVQGHQAVASSWNIDEPSRLSIPNIG